jgi:protein phosphatase
MRFYSITETGRVRSKNQDFVFATDQKTGPLSNLFLVADGMGGHNAGEFASAYAVQSVVEAIRNSTIQEPIAVLEQAITSANYKVYHEALADPDKKGMGTTLVAATYLDGHLYIANVGDSRLYVATDQELRQITRDHSLVQELVREGNLQESEAMIHPRKNMITRAVGAEEAVRTDFFDVEVRPGDQILLCTDGLTNMVSKETMTDILFVASDTPEMKAKKLVNTAEENGGRDNITVVLIEM